MSLCPSLAFEKRIKHTKQRKENVIENAWDMGQNNRKDEERRTYQTTARA